MCGQGWRRSLFLKDELLVYPQQSTQFGIECIEVLEMDNRLLGGLLDGIKGLLIRSPIQVVANKTVGQNDDLGGASVIRG